MNEDKMQASEWEPVKVGERIDDLQIQGLKVIQNPEFFCFGIDAVLLANYAQLKPQARIAEFCAGNAVISILLTAKQHPSKIFAVEMQPELADLARRSVKCNGLQDIIEVVCSDVRDLVIPENSLDAIVINPPYVRKGSGLICSNTQKHVARQETTCGIEDFLSISARCLKKGGDLFMVHRPDRLVDIFWAARRNGLEPKELTLVHPQVGKPANIALIRFRRGAGAELKMGAPIYVYDEDGRLQYAGGELYAQGKRPAGEMATVDTDFTPSGAPHTATYTAECASRRPDADKGGNLC